jgi:hypothetical protein
MPLFLPNTADTLSAMITPAVLISAAGTLSMSTSNRLARVVDRVRKLTEAADALTPPAGTLDDEAADKRDLLVQSLARLLVRMRLLQFALLGLYSAVGFLVASSLSIGLTGATGREARWLPVGLALGGAGGLLFASVQLVREVREAVGTMRLEAEYARRLIARRTGVVAPPTP